MIVVACVLLGWALLSVPFGLALGRAIGGGPGWRGPKNGVSEK